VTHAGKGDFHGITVVVDTAGPVYVGRFFEERDGQLLLLDVDSHEEGQDGESKSDYLRKSARFGVWKKHASLRVPTVEVISMRALTEISG